MSGVRNLRAMFEQKGDSLPDDRGRSPGPGGFGEALSFFSCQRSGTGDCAALVLYTCSNTDHLLFGSRAPNSCLLCLKTQSCWLRRHPIFAIYPKVVSFVLIIHLGFG
ncbi:hypothetical protein F4680DRAFT_369583 [Xylaria scruposa]|nr:hypothetical protein F4680DRAFT_369583 [Xylaria scruposa]